MDVSLMVEPVSTSAAGYSITKTIFLSLAGLFGSTSLAFFWQPKKLHAHGKMAAGAIVGGIGVGSAVTLGGVIMRYLGLDDTSADVALGVGYVVGLMSIGLIGLIASFFEKREGKDILEVVKEVRSGAANKQTRAKPVRKPAAKKAPAKKSAARKPA